MFQANIVGPDTGQDVYFVLGTFIACSTFCATLFLVPCFPVCNLMLSAAVLCGVTFPTLFGSRQPANLAERLVSLCWRVIRFGVKCVFIRWAGRIKIVVQGQLRSKRKNSSVATLGVSAYKQEYRAMKASILVFNWCIHLQKEHAGFLTITTRQFLGWWKIC